MIACPRRRLLSFVAVAAAALVAYANSFGGGFILDDHNEIVSNPAIRTLWPLWVPMTGGNMVVARPLPYLTFAIDQAIWGAESAACFHLVNVAAHLLTGVGLVVLTSDMLRRPCLPAIMRQRADLLAAASGIIWVVHPLTTAAVTYIYQRIEVMAAMFIVWSLVAAGRALAVPMQERAGVRKRWLWQAGSILSACLAAASKETAVAIPLLVAALWWIFFSKQPEQRLRNHLPFLISLAVCWGVLGVVLLTGRSDYPELQRAVYPPLRYAITQAGVLAHYVRLVFWPVGLSIDHDWPLAERVADVWPQLLGTVAVLAVSIGGFVYRAPWSYPMVAAFLLLGPTSSVLPLPDIAFEHRMYLPSFCVVVVVVCGVGRVALWLLEEHGERGRAATIGGVAGFGLVVAMLCGLTWQRNNEFADPEGLWRAVLERYPDSPRANSEIALVRAAAGDVAAAVSHAQVAARREPSRPVFQAVATAVARNGDLLGWEQTCRVGQATLASCGLSRSAGWFDLGHGVAESMCGQGRHQEAATLAATLASDAEAALGPADAVTAAIRLSLLRAKAAGPGGAAGMLDTASATVSRFQHDLGSDHPTTLAAQTILAAAFAERGRDREAEALLRGIVRVERARTVANELRVATALETLASFLLSRNKITEAVAIRTRVCDLVCPAFGVNSAVAQRHLRLLVEALEAAGRLREVREVSPLLRAGEFVTRER